MKSYVLSLVDSGKVCEIYANDDETAIEQAVGILECDLVVANQWDSDGYNDDGEVCKRILFWDKEESSVNDAGANAIAELSTVGG